MSDSLLARDVQVSDSSLVKLPISSIVRAVCQAASGGPELLYEVMIKMSLMVEATAPTYGLSIWSAPTGHKPSLRWAEGLEESEIAFGEQAVAAILGSKDRPPAANQGDQAICLLLALPSPAREGAALYGRCVRPLTTEQAKELNALSEVAFLAHARQSPRVVNNTNKSPISISSASVLPGMVSSKSRDVGCSTQRGTNQRL